MASRSVPQYTSHRVAPAAVVPTTTSASNNTGREQRPSHPPHDAAAQKAQRVVEAQTLKDAWADIRRFSDIVSHRDAWLFEPEYYFPSSAHAAKELSYELAPPPTVTQQARRGA